MILWGLQTLLIWDNNKQQEFKRYFYHPAQLERFFLMWLTQSMTLDLWKKYRYIQISKDFEFKWKLRNTEQEVKNNTYKHIRLLFDQYVEEVFQTKMKPRLDRSILVDRERSILERLFNNTPSKEDKNYLNRTFNIGPKTSLSEDIYKCLSDDITLSNIDIHSSKNFATHYALIKYHSMLENPKKAEKEFYAMWFKNKPKTGEKKQEFEQSLGDIFDAIQNQCLGNNYSDFKSLFNKNGSNVRIKWNGDEQILNFLFRKLHSVLEFKGSKWNVITFYFIPDTDKSFNPENLSTNSHYKDKSLEKKIDDLISTLSQ